MTAVSRIDIEAKLREIQSELDDASTNATPAIAGAASAGIAIVAGFAYMLGYRRARKEKTVIEVHRIGR